MNIPDFSVDLPDQMGIGGGWFFAYVNKYYLSIAPMGAPIMKSRSVISPAAAGFNRTLLIR